MRKYQQYRDEAREMTTGLCFLLAIAVVGTIVLSAIAFAAVAVGGAQAYVAATTNFEMASGHWSKLFFSRLFETGILTVLLVGATAIYKSFQLREGGGRLVAKSLGGTRVYDDTDDPGERKLLNVVEELGIASGLRPPQVFVLQDEPGINAFAAGYGAKDTVVGVTRGAVERLKRHQLEGMVAHEFSHILHGDMRLNVRLLGILTGIQSISYVARYLIRLGASPSANSRGSVGSGKHPLGMVLALAFGIVLWPIGQIGSGFALLISLAVNRQREFLADASAVQLTRNPHGLREVLEILLEDEVGSRVEGPGAQVASHMLFAAGGGAWQRLFQTHPPLDIRIQRLDPSVEREPEPALRACS